MKLAVCLTSCNRQDLTRKAIARQREIDPAIFIVVADAAKEPTKDFDCDSYIHTPGTPHGHTAHKAMMLGMASGATALVTANDDALPPLTYRETMDAEWRALDIGGSNPGILAASSENIKGPGCRREGPMERVPFVVPVFAWTTPEAYCLAPFAADIPVNWFSDDCLSIDMKREGFTLWNSSCFVEHLGSQSLKASGHSPNFDDFHGRRWMRARYGPKWMEELARM